MLPAVTVAEGHDDNSYLREHTLAGAHERYGAELESGLRERIDHELDVVKAMGFSAYFLVVWDLVRYAKSRGIRLCASVDARKRRLEVWARRLCTMRSGYNSVSPPRRHASDNSNILGSRVRPILLYSSSTL